MLKPPSIRKLVAIATVVCSSLSPIAPAQALPAYQVERTYFSDASFSEVIGDSVLNCSGQLFLTGQSSAYSTIELVPCKHDDPPPFDFD